MRVRFSLAAFMPRIKKTSSQPKRKPKPPFPVKKVIYPDYLQNFINEVESKTPFKVKIDQYAEGNSYHVGVNEKNGRVYRCIWMVGFVNGPEFLENFWSSLAVKNLNIKRD